MPLKNKIIYLLLAVCAGASLVLAILRVNDQIRNPPGLPLHALSYQFMGLEPVFANLKRAGYYSDKNMDHPLALAQFQQAQYVLAPTVLELNNTALPLVIFDCTSPQAAMAKIKELGLQPLSANKTGIILAINPLGLQ